MSGSRRNRMLNLNTQLDLARVPARPVSQPQPTSTTIPLSYGNSWPVNGSTRAPPELGRALTIEYSQITAPPPLFPTTQMNQQASSSRVSTQPHPHAPLPSHHVAIPTRPTPPTTDFVLDRIMTALVPLLATHQQSTSTRIDRIEDSVEKLVSHMTDMKDVTQSQTKQVVEAMQKSFLMQQAATRALNDRMEKLEKIIGMRLDQDADNLKLDQNRLDCISFGVEELLERAKDPQAVAIDHPVPDAKAVSRQTDVDMAIDTQTPGPHTPTPQVVPPVLVQRATSPLPLMYVDAWNDPKTPTPTTPRELEITTTNDVGNSPVRPAYVDAANDPQILEPESSPMDSMAASAVQPSVGISRTPQTPEPPRQFLPDRVPNSPTADLLRPSIANSSDAQTLVEDVSCSETKLASDVDVASVSPRLKRKRIKVAPSLEDDDVEMESLEFALNDTVPDSEEPEMPSFGKVVRMRSHFDSSPIPSGSLSAADWSDGAPDDPDSDGDHDSDTALPVFRPIFSSVTKQYSLLEGRRDSFDGTVASLRQDTLGDAHAGPAPSSSPPPPLIPFNPRPSVSPLPSPESSPSPPPPSAHGHVKTAKKRDSESTIFTPLRREPVIVSSPPPEASVSCPAPATPVESLTRVASVSSPVLNTSADLLERAALIFNPILETSVAAAPISSPARETPAPAPQEASPSPPSPPHVGEVNHNSENDSELSVMRMVTEAFDNLEELLPEPEPEMQSPPPPLFLPDLDSRSNSPPPLPVELSSNMSTPIQSPITKRRRLVASPVIMVTKTAKPVSAASSSKEENAVAVTSIKKPSLTTIKKPSPTKFMQVSVPTPKTVPTRPKPRPISTKSAYPQPITITSSPIYISSRSLSPLSDLSADSDSGPGSDSDVRIIPVKKKSKLQVKPESRSTTSAGANSKGPGDAPPFVDLKKKLLNLKQKKGQSAAVTRVKKRKASSLEEMEPPLKRAREKVENKDRIDLDTPVANKRARKSAASSSSGGKGKDGKEKEKEIGGRVKKDKSGVSASTSSMGAAAKLKLRVPPPPGCKWPEKNKTGDKKFNKQFVECDVCFLWYHYGCVGVNDLADVRIKNGELFTCPPCSSGGANPLVAIKDNIVCSRPDCGQEEKLADEFFMTGIVGRSTKVQSGTGRRYTIKDCTWEEEDGMTDPTSFIQEFNDTAAKEGIDPEEDPHSTILLREATAGGWRDPNA
ncbi:hypothetical protein FPV67DRAFT_1448717 [Lyophyllum atratum]|nr:hypothetical protein FPV67DRAFT_1448717 [Lyophyllum atratum]